MHIAGFFRQKILCIAQGNWIANNLKCMQAIIQLLLFSSSVNNYFSC